MPFRDINEKNNTEALYREGRGFSHVLVRNIIANDSGFSAMIELIEKPGYDNARLDRWKIHGDWDFFSCSEDRWSAPYLSLAVIFDDRLLRLLDEYCSKLPLEYTMDNFNAIAGFISEYQSNNQEKN